MLGIKLQRIYYLLCGGDKLRGTEDEDIARAFHLMLTGFLIWLIIQILLLLPLFGVRIVAAMALCLVLAGSSLLSLLLLRRRRKHTAAQLTLIVTWLVTAGFSFLSRGIHSAAVGWSFVVIILAGWLVGRKSAITFAIASILLWFLESVAEQAGHQFPSYFATRPIELWAVYVLFVGLAIVPVLSFLDGMRIQLSRLRESEERFSSLSNAALEAIMIHRGETILDVNMAFVRLFGYESPDELVSRADPGLLVKLRTPSLQQVNGDVARVLEFTGVKKDGSTFTGEMESRPIRYRGLDAFLVAGRDITDRKRAALERKQMQAQLLHAQKMESIGRLAGSIAHDFNNLLTVILGSSELLLEKTREADPIRASLTEIHGAGEKAAGLTQQLLAFSRKQILQPRVLDLNSLVKKMRPMLKRVVGDVVTLEFDLEAESSTIYADPVQLDSVIMNLVINARDAMPDGGRIRIDSATVEFNDSDSQPGDEKNRRATVGQRLGTYVSLAVHDNGMGMSHEIQDRIFEPFFTTKDPGKGTGLGLSMTKGIIEQSGGIIDVDSEPGHGTTFTVYFPLVSSAALEVGSKGDLPSAIGDATILVVEDRLEVRRFVVAALKSIGYTVIEATNSEEVLPLCNRHRGQVDLILSDVVMPNLGGKEMANLVRQRWPEIKLLFMSGYVDDAGLHEGNLGRGSEFIQKPFSVAQLAAKVHSCLTSHAYPMNRIHEAPTAHARNWLTQGTDLQTRSEPGIFQRSSVCRERLSKAGDSQRRRTGGSQIPKTIGTAARKRETLRASRLRISFAAILYRRRFKRAACNRLAANSTKSADTISSDPEEHRDRSVSRDTRRRVPGSKETPL